MSGLTTVEFDALDDFGDFTGEPLTFDNMTINIPEKSGWNLDLQDDSEIFVSKSEGTIKIIATFLKVCKEIESIRKCYIREKIKVGPDCANIIIEYMGDDLIEYY